MTHGSGLINIASMFQYIYALELVLFSLCLFVIKIKSRAVYIWVFSNIVSLGGVLYTLNYFEGVEEDAKAVGGAIILLSAALKSCAFVDRSMLRKSNKIPSVLLCVGIFPIIIIMLAGKTYYHVFLISISAIFIATSAIIYLIKNKIFVGIDSVKYNIFTLVTSIIALITIMGLSYPLGIENSFIPSNNNSINYLFIQSALVFVFQINFIGMVIGRQARENNFQLRRSIRNLERVTQSEARAIESSSLADERFHLLKMLTHEVRQPMNSAQAALQALNHNISLGSDAPEYMKRTVESASSTLNSIVLSISNSILGATLITKGRVQKLELTDICCVVELALLDLDDIEALRFEKKFDQPVLFADADPIILRLGVRNLLENAVKYSPRQSKIFLKVAIDDEHLTLVISVTNEIEGSARLGPDIFNQVRRGVDKKYDGYGLGLYIAKEVAKLHRGSLCCQKSNSNTVTFELALPG